MKHQEISIPEAFDRACLQYKDKTFIFHGQETYSYGRAGRMVNGFAEFLANNQISSGDKVCLVLPRRPELVLAFLGAVKIGAVPAPANYTLGHKEYNDFIKRVAPRVIVIDSEYVRFMDSDLFYDKNILKIIVGAEKSGFIPWPETCFESDFTTGIYPSLDQIAYLNFTTGSSGLPKGAIATHAQLFWNTMSAIKAFDLTDKDVLLCMFASFAHPHELFCRPIFTGGSLVIQENVNPRTIVRAINKHGVTCMMGLSPMYEMIAAHCSTMDLSPLRIAESGGMYTRPDISTDFHDKFGLPILSVWGSTETSGIALANTPQSYKTDGSMGTACPFYEVKVVDDQDQELAIGEIGELIFKGKGVIKGYEEGVDYPAKDGWYYSGDMGHRDEQGFFYFAERKSGMIKVAGLKVYPLQVELVIKEFPGIKEVAVIGVKERRHGMVPKAFLVFEESVELPDFEEIKRFCRERLANYMIPKIFEVLDELPKIGSGKINKKVLS